MTTDTPAAAPITADDRTQFDYLLNAVMRAGQADKPAEHGYGVKRAELFAYVRDLERRTRLSAPVAAQPADSAMEVNAKRYEFLRDRLLAADFDWNESGQCVLVFKWPENVAVSADCDDNIDRALTAASKERSKTHE